MTDTVKHMWDQVEKARADGTFSSDHAAVPAQDENVRAFDTTGTKLSRVGAVLTITCDSGEIANRVADQLRTPTTTCTPAAVEPAQDAKISDLELYDNSCITRHQLKNWVDSDYVAHIGGLKHTIEFLLGRLDAIAATRTPAEGADLTNHHNALKCPYCNPKGLEFARPAPDDKDTRPDERLIYDLGETYRVTGDKVFHQAAERLQQLVSLVEYGRKCLLEIQKAAVEGRVCDDVAWFSTIETLHDYCAVAADRLSPSSTERQDG